MSPAQQHRERVLARLSTAAAPVDGGGHPFARQIDGAALASSADAAVRLRDVLTTLAATPRAAAAASAQVALRLTHDLRRLKEIKSIDRKVAAKREMLPEYAPWIDGLVAADAGVGTGVAAEVLPTIMVWTIDVGDYAAALPLAAFAIRHQVPMPARYSRDVATLVLELIAEAALRAQAAGERFPVDVLEQVDALTCDIDMHDEARAKLVKALGVELDELAGTFDGAVERTVQQYAAEQLRRAQKLDPRSGVKTRLTRLEKALAASAEPAAAAA